MEEDRGGGVTEASQKRPPVLVTLELPAGLVDCLRVLGEPAEVLKQLAEHVQQGVLRPSEWQRHWLVQAFGDTWFK